MKKPGCNRGPLFSSMRAISQGRTNAFAGGLSFNPVREDHRGTAVRLYKNLEYRAILLHRSIRVKPVTHLTQLVAISRAAVYWGIVAATGATGAVGPTGQQDY